MVGAAFLSAVAWQFGWSAQPDGRGGRRIPV